MTNIPKTQHAVQLVGPDELLFNDAKEIILPGKHQILCKVEAVGLCFSDLKLLKQFSSHVRKGPLVSGVDLDILKEIPSYVPDEKPAVPGHEAVVRIAAVGDGIEDYKVGERYLVQADCRWLRTETTNGAFGYNFEGGLQQYVLMDERIFISPQDESTLLPVTDEHSASAIALVEPWGCVEDAYVSKERQTLIADGQMLIVADVDVDPATLVDLLDKYGKPAKITWLSKAAAPEQLNVPTETAADISELKNAAYDDVIYFGSNPETLEAVFTKIATGGLLNIVLCGSKFGRDIDTAVGLVHYGGIRIIGTTGHDPAEAMRYIPKTDEIRKGDKINIVGAAGPMGVMHVIRNMCQAVEGISIFAGDMDNARLKALSKIAEPIAKQNNIEYQTYNPAEKDVAGPFDYTVLMAPIPALAAAAVKKANSLGLINIFAGIPATVTGDIDLDTYIEKQLYFIGTSGSTIDDMKRVLAKVESGQLNTNVSVAAICGLEHAVEGIRAVENRLIAGKILVYPSCEGLELIKLEELKEKLPDVAACLDNGLWTNEAEQKLLEMYE